MKYIVDVERKLAKIKTFEIDASTKEEAIETALNQSRNQVWDMSCSNVEIGVMSCGIVN